VGGRTEISGGSGIPAGDFADPTAQREIGFHGLQPILHGPSERPRLVGVGRGRLVGVGRGRLVGVGRGRRVGLGVAAGSGYGAACGNQNAVPGVNTRRKHRIPGAPR